MQFPAHREPAVSPSSFAAPRVAPAAHPAAHRHPALVCPSCRATLEPCADGGALTCGGGHAWPVRARIPRFVGSDNYAHAFGAQWLEFRRTQLDSFTGTTISRDRARRCLGQRLAARLDAGEPLTVLEVGCGAGRFTELLLESRALVTSLDLSVAVEANARNFPVSERHRVLQADVNALPFVPGQYDVVFCLGVVQHTPDPETTLARLFEQVRPGGTLVVDHYAPDVGWRLSAKPLYRAVLKRLPDDVALRWTCRLVDAFLPWHVRLGGRGRAHSLLSRISPVLHYYSVLPLSASGHREWALLDTHDALTDWYKHRRTPAQLRASVEALGAADVWCEPGGIGVELRARRPVA